MNANDFREDLNPTRGQHEQIAREFARLAGEPYPATRVSATELLLRLRTTPTPDPAPEPAPAAPAPASARESAALRSAAVSASRAAAAPRVTFRSAGT